MDRCLLLVSLVALIYQAHSLKCHSCMGADMECKSTEVTCPGSSDKCGTSTMTINSFPCKSRMVFRGCIKNATVPSRKISITPSNIVRFSLQEETCDTDLCNDKTITDPKASPNDLYCLSCIAPDQQCNSEQMKTIRCTGNQTHCVDVKIVGSFGDMADINLKGCGEITSCSKKLIYSSENSSVSVTCCDSNFCNSMTDFAYNTDKSPNGVQCYSCNTLDGSKCSPEEAGKVQCYGPLTKCLEVAGMTIEDGKEKPTVIKGCATPNMCEIAIIPLLQKLGSSRVECCNGSLCNNKFTEDNLQATGYFPVEKPTANGIKRPPYYANPVKIGQASNNFGSTDTFVTPSTYDTDSNVIEGFGLLNDPSVFETTNNGQQNNFNYDSWNGNSNGGGPNLTSTSYDDLSSVISDSINNESLSTEIIESTEVDLYSDIEETDNDESNMTDGVDSYLAGDDSNLNTTLQGPFEDAWDINSNGGPTLNPPSSNEFSNASSGSINNANPTSSYELSSSNISSIDSINGITQPISGTVYDEFYNNSLYSDEEDIFSDSYFASDSYSEEDDNSSSITPQGPTVINGVLNIPQDSSEGYVVSEVDQNTEYSANFNNTGSSTGSNAITIGSALDVSKNGSNNSVYNSLITSQETQSSYHVVQSSGYDTNVFNTSSALPGHMNGYGSSNPSTGHHTGENNTSSTSYTGVGGGMLPTNGWSNNNGSNQNMMHSDGHGYATGYDYNQKENHNGSSSYSSNSVIQNTESTHGNGSGVRGNDSTSSNSNPASYSNPNNLGSSHGNNFGYVSNILFPGANGTNGNYSNLISLLSNVTGISSTLLSQKLNGSNMANHKNLTNELSSIPGLNLNELPPELKAYISDNNSNSSQTYSNHGTSGVGGFIYNSNQMPPEGYNHGDSFGHDSSFDTYAEGGHYGNGYMEQGGSSNEPSHTNTNNLGSSYGNNFGYDSHIPLPGANWTNGNYSNLIVMLSNATGISPALLSQKLNGSTMANPSILVSELSSFPGFDPNKLSPELKAFMFGNSSQQTHTYHTDTGYNINKLPPGWNISNFSNSSYLVNILANITGISPALLSQKLNRSNTGNHSNLADELSRIHGFNLTKLPPELKAYILGSNSNTSQTYSNNGTSGVGGSVYNSDHIPPEGYNHGDTFGHGSSYGTYGDGGHSDGNHFMGPGGSSNEAPYTNTNNLGSSYGNNSDLINMLSSITGISPTLLSEKLNGSNIANHSNMANALATIPGFDTDMLPPNLKSYIYGNSNDLSHTYSSDTGTNHNMPPPAWHGTGYDIVWNDTNEDNASLPGRATNDSAAANGTDSNNGNPLRSKAGVLAIVLTMTLLLLT